MKTAAKVFIILGMIFGCIAILPLIFGGIGLSKINSAKDRSELVGMGVCVLLFCSLLGGIFMLCIPNEQLAGAGAGAGAQNQQVVVDVHPTQTKQSDDDATEKLAKLKNLKDSGAISDEEFERMKKDILAKV